MAVIPFEVVSQHRCFKGTVGFYKHEAASTSCTMKFSVFTPPQAQSGKVPVLYYLAGLTCTEETFMIKAGAQRIAAELGIMLVVVQAGDGADDALQRRIGRDVAHDLAVDMQLAAVA